MKKLLTIALAMIMTLAANAQNDTREPGLYYVDGDNSTPLTHINAITKNTGTQLLGVIDIGHQKQSYKGLTSDTQCTKAEFVLVIDPSLKGAKMTPKKYNPFIKTMTPELMALLPLTLEKKNRAYDEGRTLNGFRMKTNNSIEFEYEQITDNSWMITAELPAGEYIWAFKVAKHGSFNLASVFDFTIE